MTELVGDRERGRKTILLHNGARCRPAHGAQFRQAKRVARNVGVVGVVSTNLFAKVSHIIGKRQHVYRAHSTTPPEWATLHVHMYTCTHSPSQQKCDIVLMRGVPLHIVTKVRQHRCRKNYCAKKMVRMGCLINTIHIGQFNAVP